MKKISLFIIIITLLSWSLAASAASETAKKLAGQIIYSTDKPTEFWLVDNNKFTRSIITDYKVALNVFKKLFAGISEANFKKISGPINKNNNELVKKFLDKIVLRVEKRGAAWFLNSRDKIIYDLSDKISFFKNLTLLATPVTAEDLAKIHKPSLKESLDKYSSYEYKKIKTDRGSFTIDIVKIDLSDPDLKIISDTAQDFNCKTNCQAKSLYSYLANSSSTVFAAINGTYFCSSRGCETNYYFFPVYNTAKNILINEDQLKYWTTGPLIAFDNNNKFYYFKDSRDFKSVREFEEKNKVSLQALIGNKPRLVEDGKNALIEWEVDAGQRNGKYLRNAIGYQDKGTNGQGLVYLVVARSATLDDLAVIMKELKMDYALNLDGGSSAALFYNDEYMVGPGRDIPNVLMFAK